jgi:hypothetical protein
MTVLAVFAGTFAGLRLLSPAPPSQIPADTHTRPVYERTATIEGVTVTSPSDWYLVNDWPKSRNVLAEGNVTPFVLPILQISSFDAGLGASICRGDGASGPIPAGGLVLAVGVTIAGKHPPTDDQPCGVGSYARATIDRGGSSLSYFVWWNDPPSDATQSATDMLDALGSQVVTSLEQLATRTDLPAIAFPGTETAGYVLWGGTNEDGSTFTIEARPEGPNIDLKLVTHEVDGTYGEGGFAAFGVPPAPVDGGFMGAVTEDAASVEFRRADGGPPGVALLADLPPSLGYAADAYYFPTGYPTKVDSFDGKLVALAADGSVMKTATGTAASGVIASGDVPGTQWRLQISSKRAASSESIPVDLQVRQGEGQWANAQQWNLSATDVVEYRTYAFTPFNGNSTEFLFYGIAPPGTTEVVLPQESRDLTIPASELVPIVDDAGTTVGLAFARDDAFIPVPGPIQTTDANGEQVVRQSFELQLGFPGPDVGRTVGGTFGVDWRIDQGTDGLTLTIDNGATGPEHLPWLDFGAALVRPTGLPLNQAFNAVALVLTGTNVDTVCVTSEGRWCGRWMPSRNVAGDEARLWVIELPGAGVGQLWFDDQQVGSISWP